MTDAEITDAMIRCGGSFVQALGRLYGLADDENPSAAERCLPALLDPVFRVGGVAQGGGDPDAERVTPRYE